MSPRARRSGDESPSSKVLLQVLMRSGESSVTMSDESSARARQRAAMSVGSSAMSPRAPVEWSSYDEQRERTTMSP
jgi:hypothetical protein